MAEHEQEQVETAEETQQAQSEAPLEGTLEDEATVNEAEETPEARGRLGGRNRPGLRGQ